MKRIAKWLPLLAAMSIGAIASAATPKLVCNLTGKESETCCCEKHKDGKLLCKNTGKILETCCCTKK